MIESDDTIIDRHEPSVRPRARIELAIVHELIKRLKAAGYTLAVDDGGDEEEKLNDEQEIVTAVFAVDEARLVVTKEGSNKISYVFLVMGNDGYDVICDYGTSLDPIMDPLLDWVNETYAS
jgi:hypothetical protein